MSDKIIKCLAYDGRVSITCIDSTKLVEEARIIHDLSPVCTAAMGRLLTVSALMGCEMKSEKHRLTVQLKGNGPIGQMVVASDNTPRVKCYLANPHVDLPLNEFGKLDVGGAVGTNGFINVIKDIGLKEPYIGISPLVSGEIAEDFANYFVNSEQTNTAVVLGVLVDKNGVKNAGGYIITPMPDATESDISSVEKAIFEAGAISRMLEKNMDIEEIAKKVTGDENLKVIEVNDNPRYECDCNKDKFKKALISIGKADLKEIIEEDGKAEMVCNFCNAKYNFDKEELENIFENM